MGDVVASQEEADRKPAILVVEDEVLLRTVIADYLRDAGFTVVEAANATEAMALMASQIPVDIVFTDIQLGDGPDGLALADWIDAHCAGLPVLLTSGGFAPIGKTRERPFISKPYIYLQLEKRLRELLAQKSTGLRNTKLFKVSRIGQNELSRIEAACGELPIVAAANLPLAVVCTRETVMAKLTDHVAEDTAENTETLAPGVQFEFVSEVNQDGELLVRTRLFPAEAPGITGALYGPKIVRTGDNTYLFFPA